MLTELVFSSEAENLVLLTCPLPEIALQFPYRVDLLLSALTVSLYYGSCDGSHPDGRPIHTMPW